ncbi:hypothetical protein GMES_3149 [Paraglaciecola mesophila KMM 241]|uniref:Uncharacterized protein n=1 Tax=Paraglaciecola mesophila KMM 241 TaxID=1128912 RepID=K6XXW0_9ALTE|nr:hypothetical protein [Paraglaciecola mesophila]GAC25434.1 hypothetical protein GMES_3149 [Paraglaciecola mesophila KMM 241]
MSNIAGKSYAMNVITPLTGWVYYWNRVKFAAVQFSVSRKLGTTGFWGNLVPMKLADLIYERLNGLLTLSLIHYARWTVIKQFPHIHATQPKEQLKYHYMMFFSNFNGSWKQYVDSFHMAIPNGLDMLWYKNVKYPNSVPLQPFHSYITYNQIWTNHYYNAYPLAASNDIKGAEALTNVLKKFIDESDLNNDPALFQRRFEQLLDEQQRNLGLMAPTPIISLSAEAVMHREA